MILYVLLEIWQAEFARSIRLAGEGSEAGRILACQSTALGARFRFLALFEGVQDFLGGLRSQVFIKIVADDKHWSITASTLTLDLDDSELSILGCLSWFDATRVLTDSVKYLSRSTKHAWRSCADLDKMFADRFSVEHGVESSDFVNTHRGHLKKVGNIVHDTNACPSLILALAEVQEGDDCSFLVLRWIMRDNFLGTL